MKKLKFAIIGTNFISEHFAEAVLKSERAELFGIYSRSEQKGAEFAKRYQIPEHYTSLAEMLSEPLLDAVYVASPTMCHKEHTIAALLAGKHTLTEKMIAVRYSEFSEMRNAARSGGLVLLEAMRPDFDSLLSKLPLLLPKLGEIQEACFEFCQYSSRYDKFKAGIIENAFNPDMKNSALSDIGIYPLHLSVKLFGKPRSILAKSHFLENGFEGAGELILDYGAFKSKISYSKIHEGENISVIKGTLGALSFEKMNAPREMKIEYADGHCEIFEAEGDNMLLEVDAFAKCVSGEYDPTPLLDTTEDTMVLVEEIYKQTNILK